jgi:DNA-binding winged helix-turn-helix (wHTH) protein
MLALLAANAGGLLSKRELIEAVWPEIQVAEDSPFKCIREIRTALGDDKYQLIRLMCGFGYLFDADVTHEPATPSPGRGKSRDRKAHGTAARLKPRQRHIAAQERVRYLSGGRRTDRTHFRRRGIARALTSVPNTNRTVASMRGQPSESLV